MKSAVKKLRNCKVRLTVDVDSGILEDRFREVFQEIQKVAQLPGFRQGKVPMDLVQKKFAHEAHEEVLKSLIPDTYHQVVAGQKLSPVSLPSVSDIKMERGKNLTFAAEFEEAPNFSLKNYKGLRIKKAPIDVHEADVEKAVESLRDSKAEFVPALEPRAVRHGDFVIADIEIWNEDKYVPGRQGILLSVAPGEGDDFYQKVLGARVNEVREVAVGEKPAYKVWIRGLQEKKLPELGDEWAKNFGKESMEALREAIRKDVARYKQSESYEGMKEELFEKLLGLVSFELPESLVAKQKERLIEQARKYKQPEEGAAEKAASQVKLYFILQKIAEAEHIDVDELELDKRLAGLAAQSQRPLEEVRKVFEEDVRESMREAKTVEFLLANAKLEEINPVPQSKG